MQPHHDPSPEILDLKHNLVAEFWAPKNIVFLCICGTILYVPLIAWFITLLLFCGMPLRVQGIVGAEQFYRVADVSHLSMLLFISKATLLVSTISLILQHPRRHRNLFWRNLKRTVSSIAICYVPAWICLIILAHLSKNPDISIKLLQTLALILNPILIPFMHFMLSLVGATPLLRINRNPAN
jgi:hypothetical protein